MCDIILPLRCTIIWYIWPRSMGSSRTPLTSRLILLRRRPRKKSITMGLWCVLKLEAVTRLGRYSLFHWQHRLCRYSLIAVWKLAQYAVCCIRALSGHVFTFIWFLNLRVQLGDATFDNYLPLYVGDLYQDTTTRFTIPTRPDKPFPGILLPLLPILSAEFAYAALSQENCNMLPLFIQANG